MKKAKKLASFCFCIFCLGAVLSYIGNQWGDFYQVYKEHEFNKIMQGANAVRTGNYIEHGNTFDSEVNGFKITGVPVGTSLSDIAKHYVGRFKNDEYNPFKSSPPDMTLKEDIYKCIPFQNYLDTAHKSNKYKINVAINDYANYCGSAGYVQMSYKAPIEMKIKTTLKPYFTNAGWLMLAAFGWIPFIWMGFWRIVGIAYRSAKKQMKGEE